MKTTTLILAILLAHLFTSAQGVAINETGVGPDVTSLLDISSHTKGLLIPRLRTIERIAIVAPAEGLLVYDTDTYSFWFAKLGVWNEIADSGDAFTLPYN